MHDFEDRPRRRGVLCAAVGAAAITLASGLYVTLPQETKETISHNVQSVAENVQHSTAVEALGEICSGLIEIPVNLWEQLGGYHDTVTTGSQALVNTTPALAPVQIATE